MDTHLDTDEISTVYYPPPRRRRPTKVIVAIVACLVVLAGATTGTVLMLNPWRWPTQSYGSTTSGTGGGTVDAFPTPKATPKPKPAKTRADACWDGDSTVKKCPKGWDQGPALPRSLRGQPYVCLLPGASTGPCEVIFVHHPATGECVQFSYIAPQAPGTEDGWKQDADAEVAEYMCP
jgi:hypothetical protein